MGTVNAHWLRRAKTVRADLLRFGDVILTSGYDLTDYGVVMATRRGNPARRYSHAALVIHPAVWLESTGEGTGLTHFKLAKSGETGQPTESRIDVSHYRRIDVFRMTGVDLSRIDPSSAKFGEILDSFIGFEYPVLDALADTTKWLANWPEIKRRLMAKATRTEVVHPGDFCSQLIVDLFNACKEGRLLDVGVLAKEMPSCNVSPNDLADPHLSRLQRMENLVELGPVPQGSAARAAELAKISYDFDPNIWVDIGNRFRADRIASGTNEKRLENVVKLLNDQSHGFQAATANLVRVRELRLLASEDHPLIEEDPQRPELRQIQENSLKSGLNPAWLRMEGAASRFVRQVQEWRQFLFSTSEKLTAITDQLRVLPSARLRSFLLHNKLGALPVALEVQASSVDFAREMEPDLLRGFASDREWVDVIKQTAAGFLLDLAAFQKHLAEVQRTWSAPNRRTLKVTLRDIARLQTAAQGFSQSIERYVAALDSPATKIAP